MRWNTPWFVTTCLITACTPGNAPPPDSDFVQEVGLTEGDSPTINSPGWTPPAKVVVMNLWPGGRTESLSRVAPGVELVVVENADEAAAQAGDADAVLGVLTPQILENGQRLRWIQLTAAGVERYIALPGFAERPIVLTNAQRIFANGGAEHTLGMMLTLSRRLHTARDQQRNGQWNPAALTGPNPYAGTGSELMELRHRTVLVAGLGGIGTEVARLASGIGMRVIATRNSSREGPAFIDYVGLSSELAELIPEADVIVNSLPLTPDTENLFNQRLFALTKPTAFFINIGRGRTVDQEALVQALKTGRIAGAGLDVTEPEPLPRSHELWRLPNVIITPHIGGDSDAHMDRMFRLFRENLRRFAAGERLLSVVDPGRGY